MLEDFLLQVNKPGRYIGNEWNVSRKDFARARIKFALCFPDLYEVGMSNLGIRIIYGILNNIADVVCERVFSCDTDMERLLRHNRLEIFSLETRKNLKEFDILGFSLGYELGYTNVLNILELGGIPLSSSLRDNSYPLVIGGGPCAVNPEPLHEFFDLFIVGEAEEVILEIIDLYRKYQDEFRAGQLGKEGLLINFSQIEGVYAPSLYQVKYGAGGELDEFRPKVEGIPKKIKKRFVKDLDKAYFPSRWLVPYIQTVHDRVSLEIMRGCPNRCRFCQAHSQYFPFRQRNLNSVLNLACDSYKQTGYEELSLCGLSVSDYPYIRGLLEKLVQFFQKKAVGVSLPSIKPNAMVGDMSSLIASVKKTGLTFAPEAGTERLRNIIAKDFNLDDFSRALQQAYTAGYQHIKLYFMIGLPAEEDQDLDGIIEFATQASDLRKKINKGPAQVNISINTLIPKPHTPFQWLRMSDLDNIKYKQDYLRKKIRNKRLKLNFHNRSMSILEGILSRGDRRLSEVILRAYEKGARFDAWQNYFNFDTWLEAFSESRIDPHFYLKEKSTEQMLPWDFLETGISKESFWLEFNKAIAIK